MKVFYMGASCEPERPRIDFATGSTQFKESLAVAGQVLMGILAEDQWPTVNLYVQAANAHAWHCYSGSNLSDLYSERARELIEPYANEYFTFLPAYINGVAYYCLKPKKSLDCLDLEHSVVEYYKSAPDKIISIEKCCFRNEMIEDPLVFTFPERLTSIYATESIKDLVENNRLKGIRFLRPEEIEC